MRVRIPTPPPPPSITAEDPKASQHTVDPPPHANDPPIPSPSSFCTNRVLTKTRIPAGHGYAFPIARGSRFRIIDLHGEQVVDMFAWLSHNPLERLSPAYTRYHLHGVAPALGEHLYTNGDHAILRVMADTVKVHDMTYMACYPALYASKGLPNHRSCAQNVVEAMRDAGFAHVVEGGVLSVPEPFNCFQNTPVYSLKAMGSSKPGDYIEFEAQDDLLVALSCCPYEIGGFNGGVITDVAVVLSEAEK